MNAVYATFIELHLKQFRVDRGRQHPPQLPHPLLLPCLGVAVLTLSGGDTRDPDATVTIDDVQPAIAVVKTADPTSVPEGDGPVTFTV